MTRPWWMQGWVARGNTAELVSDELLYPADVARIIAAAPAMARALCLVEWTDNVRGDMCRACGRLETEGHRNHCPLDAALTAAGLSPEDREQVRKAMR